jgi:hypothetical protein
MGLLSKIFGHDQLKMQDVSEEDNDKMCDSLTSEKECVQLNSEQGSSDENISPFLAEEKESSDDENQKDHF